MILIEFWSGALAGYCWNPNGTLPTEPISVPHRDEHSPGSVSNGHKAGGNTSSSLKPRTPGHWLRHRHFTCDTCGVDGGCSCAVAGLKEQPVLQGDPALGAHPVPPATSQRGQSITSQGGHIHQHSPTNGQGKAAGSC